MPNRFIDALNAAMPDLTKLPDHASLCALETELVDALGRIGTLRTKITTEKQRRRKPYAQAANIVSIKGR